MIKYLFYYEVSFYESDNEKPARGFLHAETFAKAATSLDKFYAPAEMKLRMIGDTRVLEIPDDVEFDLSIWEAHNGF